MERVRRRIFAGLAACALTGGAITAAMPDASAATTACGSSCFTFAADEYGDTYVSAIPAQDAEQGSVVTLARSGNYSSEDFSSLAVGTTTQLYRDALIPAVLAVTWPGDEMYEYEFTPDGQASNLCIGTATTAANGTGLTLQPCGLNDLTLWLPLPKEAVNGWEPIVAGSDSRSISPYVMTAGRFEAQLTTEELASPEPSSQLWIQIFGAL
jgi:hypothetical protein